MDNFTNLRLRRGTLDFFDEILMNMNNVTVKHEATYFRLCRSSSSLTISIVVGVCSGLCDRKTEELDERTVVVLDPWNVLKENCGPIHNRLCGPACVIIST